MAWVQPVLTANGTIGLSEFAVASGGGAESDAYKAFDSLATSYVNKMNSGAWLEFYSAVTLTISDILITSNQCLPSQGIFQVSYDDGATWEQIGSWQDEEEAGNSAHIVFSEGVATGNYFRFVSQGKSLAKPSSNADFCNVAITAEVGGDFDFYADTERKISNKSLLAEFLKVWLPFDTSTTEDLCGNTWTASGSPAIEDNALKLDGSSYIQADIAPIELFNSDFTIHFWMTYQDSKTSEGGFFTCDNTFAWQCYESNARFNADCTINGRSRWLEIDSVALSEFKNTKHHFAIVRKGDTLYFFFDGALRKTYTVGTFTGTGSTLYIGKRGSNYTKMIMDEFMIHTAALWTEDFTPPAEEDYLQGKLAFGSANFNFTADVERKVSTAFELNADIEIRIWKRWWYINPGDADDLIIASTVLTNLPETQSRTGTAFYQTARQKCFDLPTTDEVWIKFDVYFDGSNSWRAYNGESGKSDGITALANGNLEFYANGKSKLVYTATGACTANQLQTVLLHMVSDSTAGIVEAWVDGALIYTYTGNVNNGNDFADIYLQSDGAGTFFSNVIISNVEISLNDGGITFFNKVDVERVLTNADWSPVPSLKVWLPFNKSITEDLGGNTWTVDSHAPPIDETNAVCGDAFQLRKNYPDISTVALSLNGGITLGGKSFTVKFSFTLTQYPDYWNEQGFWVPFMISLEKAGSIFSEAWSYNGFGMHLTRSTHNLYAVCFGERFLLSHIELKQTYFLEYVYHHGLGKFFFFVNGELLASIDKTISETHFPYLYIDGAHWPANHVVGALDEFRIYDGAALHTESFTAPTVENYIADTLALEKQCPFGFRVTTEREIINNRQTVHRYIAFTGENGCYGEIPLETLAGKTTFTVEVEFSTTSTYSNSTAYHWNTMIGRDIGGAGAGEFNIAVNGGKLCFWGSKTDSSSYSITSDKIINDGQIHRIAVRSNDDGSLDLFCDDELIAYKADVNAYISPSSTLLISCNQEGGQGQMAMKFYEARLWSVARTREEIFTDIEGGGVLFTDIEGNEEGLEAWYVPDARTDIIPDMTGHERHVTLHGDPTVSFVYEMNFDYTVPIECEIYFLADSPSDVFSTLENGGFYQTEIKKCFNLPPTYNIWIDFDVYFDGEHRWRAGNAGANGITGATSQTNMEISFVDCDEAIKSVADICKKKTLQNVCLHMIADEKAGLIEARVDGKTVYTYRGSVNQGEPFSDIFLQSDGAGTYFTSILISTSEKPPERERSYDFNVVRKVLNASIMWTQSWEYALGGFGLSPIPLELPGGEGIIVYILSQPEIEKIFDLPPTYDIWIDFDVYFDGESKWRAGNVNDNGICGLVALTTSPLLYLSNDETVQAVPNVCKAGKTYPILLHMKAGETDGVIETWVNGSKLYTYTGDVNHGEDFYDLFLQCDTANTYFSNVTFSTDRLEPRCYIEPIYFCVRYNDEILSFPMRPSDTSSTPALAIRYGGENWYNALCAPSDEKAGNVHVWHNNTEYALSKIL